MLVLAAVNADFWVGVVTISSALVIAVSIDLVSVAKTADPTGSRIAIVLAAFIIPLAFVALALMALAGRWDSPASGLVFLCAVIGPAVELFLLFAAHRE